MLEHGIFNQVKVVNNNTLKKLDKFSSFVRVISNFNLLKRITEDKLLLTDLNNLNIDSISRLDTEPHIDKKQRQSISGFQRKRKVMNTTEMLQTNDVKMMKLYLEKVKAERNRNKSCSNIGLFKNSFKKSFISRPSTTNTKNRINSTTAIETGTNLQSTPFITAMCDKFSGMTSQTETPMLTAQSFKSMAPMTNLLIKRTHTAANVYSFAEADERTDSYKKTILGFKKKFTEALLNNLNKSAEEAQLKEANLRAKRQLNKEKVEKLKQELEQMKPLNYKEFSSLKDDKFSRNNYKKVKMNGITKTTLNNFNYKYIQSKYMTVQNLKTKHKDDTLNLLTDNCEQIIVTSKKNSNIKFNVPSRNKNNLDYIDIELRQRTVDGMKNRAFVYGDKNAGASMEHLTRLNNTVYKLKPSLF
jgi:hypothetical protein